MALPNLIIAGTHKAGTTSLFRYLVDHPSVCASSVKEPNFFTRFRDKIDQAALEYYESFFHNCSPECEIILEASPIYIMGGRETAKLIKKILPNVRLIFVLRDPIERLASFFERNQSKSHRAVADVSFDDFVERSTRADVKDVDANDDESARGRWLVELRKGCYAGFLRGFFEYFPNEDICILFYDQMRDDVASLVRGVCTFAGIDRDFYDGYNFTVENRTENYRFKNLHRTKFVFNMHFEPFLNRFPEIRRTLRTIYNSINRKRSVSRHISLKSDTLLRQYYEPQNLELRSLLKEKYPTMSLPEWVDSGNVVDSYIDLKRPDQGK